MYLGMHTIDELIVGFLLGCLAHYLYNVYFEEWLFKFYRFLFKASLSKKLKWLLYSLVLNIILLTFGILLYYYDVNEIDGI